MLNYVLLHKNFCSTIINFTLNDPSAIFSEKGVFLGSDLKWESPPGCVTFYGNCLVIQALSSNTTGEVDIHGDIFVHGIVAPAPSRITFKLEYGYKFLKTCVGVSANLDSDNTCSSTNNKAAAKFRILGDGQALKMDETQTWIEKSSKQQANCFQISVGHISRLELETQEQPSSEIKHECVFSTWADAAVIPKGKILKFARNEA